MSRKKELRKYMKAIREYPDKKIRDKILLQLGKFARKLYECRRVIDYKEIVFTYIRDYYNSIQEDDASLRVKLLEGMCIAAENMSPKYGPDRFGIHIDGKCPEAFRSGVGDKFIFNKIINSVLPNIRDEWPFRETSRSNVIGVNILAKFYYPYFGEFDKQQEKEDRK